MAAATDVANTLAAQWRLAIENRLLGTFSVEGEAFRADPRGRALLGLDATSAVALTTVLDQLHVDDREGVADGVAGVVVNPSGVWRREVRTATVPERQLVISASGTEVGGVVGVVGVIEDVSEERRVARALERAERARDLIAGSLAHDLRGPVFNIIMAADLLASRGQAEDQGALRRVLSGARRVTMKVEELVCFARLSIGDGVELAPARLDLHALTARCVERATATSSSESDVSQSPRSGQHARDPRSVVAVSATGDTSGTWDASMISAALLTLIDNALRHGNSVVVNVVVDGSNADNVTVTIHNDGVIPPELIAMMFELVRAPRSDVATSGGLGLGLFNARQIASAHGGAITLESTPSTGTTFALRLPRHLLAGSTRRASAALEESATTASFIDETAIAQTLQERAPREYWLLLDRYTRLLEVSLHRRMFKNASEALPEEVTRLAEELGALNAGAREVADLHARALRRASLMASASKSEALVTEGRLLSLELMGRLLSYYRKRAGPSPRKGQP